MQSRQDIGAVHRPKLLREVEDHPWHHLDIQSGNGGSYRQIYLFRNWLVYFRVEKGNAQGPYAWKSSFSLPSASSLGPHWRVRRFLALRDTKVQYMRTISVAAVSNVFCRMLGDTVDTGRLYQAIPSHALKHNLAQILELLAFILQRRNRNELPHLLMHSSWTPRSENQGFSSLNIRRSRYAQSS